MPRSARPSNRLIGAPDQSSTKNFIDQTVYETFKRTLASASVPKPDKEPSVPATDDAHICHENSFDCSDFDPCMAQIDAEAAARKAEDDMSPSWIEYAKMEGNDPLSHRRTISITIHFR